MTRYWALENELLATLHLHPASENLTIRQALLSAIMFGGLLDPRHWRSWAKSVGSAYVLPEPVAIFFHSPGGPRMWRRWFADPVTTVLLKRLVLSRQSGTTGVVQEDRFVSFPALGGLMALGDEDFLDELEKWVLPGAQFKFTLQCPPILVA